MALWTDRDFVTTADLRAIDPEVLRIATEHGIVLTGPNGVIRQAIDECGIELMTIMQSPGMMAMTTPSGIPAGHTMALTGMSGQTTRLSLSQIVVSEDRPYSMSPIKRWVTYKTLLKVFGVATERQSGDRYSLKWERVNREVDEKHWPFLVSQGVPMVRYPLAAPAAGGEWGSGTWSPENVSVIPGTGNISGRILVAVSYTSRDYVNPQDRKNAESAQSEAVEVIIDSPPKGLRVDIASLTPLAEQNPAQRYMGGFYRQAATGWNIWAGKEGQSPVLYLQNDSPIPIETKQWDLDEVVIPGPHPAHPGQWPDVSMTVQRVFMRG